MENLYLNTKLLIPQYFLLKTNNKLSLLEVCVLCFHFLCLFCPLISFPCHICVCQKLTSKLTKPLIFLVSERTDDNNANVFCLVYIVRHWARHDYRMAFDNVCFTILNFLFG
uniref:Uncharacterized protein n=1 Tax=Cacopsylla melanoneura TaxID=428564 RepID=A0A8D8Q901_9HEMI